MTNYEEKTEYFEILGRDKEGTIWMLDYTFIHDNDFKGATGTNWYPVTKEEYEERLDVDYLMYEYKWLWQQIVKDGKTEDSLEQWAEQLLNSGEAEEFLWDTSYRNKWDDIRELFPELNEEDYPVFRCTGGGRCFHNPIDIDWDVLLKPELVKVIEKYES